MSKDDRTHLEVKIRAREAWDLTMALVSGGTGFEAARQGAALTLAVSEQDCEKYEYRVTLPAHTSGETPRDGDDWIVLLHLRPRSTLNPYRPASQLFR